MPPAAGWADSDRLDLLPEPRVAAAAAAATPLAKWAPGGAVPGLEGRGVRPLADEDWPLVERGLSEVCDGLEHE